MNYTQKQRQAIETDARNIIVSAAAGSGKTSVLTARTIRLVSEGTDIENILVVTFTRAAAAEMRQRITAQLYAEAQRTGDMRLREQAEKTSAADISTFHSFCAKVLRENYDIAGISPSFRILGDYEAAKLKSAALREIFDAKYEQDDAGFHRLLARYTRRSSDTTLASHMLRIHGYMMGRKDPFAWASAPLETDAVQRAQALTAIYEAQLLGNLYKAQALLSDGQAICRSHADAEGAHTALEWFGAQQKYVSGLIKTAQVHGLSSLEEKLGGTPLSLRGVPKQAQPFVKRWAELARPLIKEAAACALCRGSAEDIATQLKHTDADAAAMIELIKAFDAAYADAKADAGALDYADLEHMALAVLREKGDDYSKRYAHVFIDEYQDTSQVQEEIIRLVSRESCAFMVGDMKQSIYRFRMADPDIFKRKVRQHEQQQGAVIYMNDNFRSKDAVISAVNALMDAVMNEQLGGISYTAGERLAGSAPGGDAQIMLCNMQCEQNSALGEEKAQAEMIAGRIVKALQSGTRPGDIAVLMRSRSATAVAVQDALDARGIPCSISLSGARQVRELDLIAGVLKLADNIQDDVALLSVMRSFIGGFCEDDFAQIRALGDGASFYSAAISYMGAQPGDLADRLTGFFEKFDRLALRLRSMPLNDFIDYVLDTFDFDIYMACLPGGGYKKEAYTAFVQLLHELAESADGSLYLLLRALRDVRASQGGYALQNRDLSGDYVKIMTIHQSKGLEFNTVFVADLNRRFNSRDENESFLLDDELGILPYYVDEQTFIKRTTIAREVCRQKMRQQNLSEELRMLYVAITRAKENLYLTGYIKDEDTALPGWSALRYEDAQCMLDWVMAATQKQGALPFQICGDPLGPAPAQQSSPSPARGGDLPCLIELPPVPQAPAKVSVSAVRRAEVTEHAHTFFQAEMEEDSEITGARLGTLVHTLMERLVPGGGDILQTVDGLLAKNLITQQEHDAALASAPMIECFLASPLYARIARSPRVLKEQAFNLRVPAASIGLAGGDVLVQGILDLAFLEDGKWVLVDYKTDRVKKGGLEEKAAAYKVQIDLYAKALRDITKTPVAARYLYFMRAGTACEV